MLLNNGFTFTNILSDNYTIENEFPEYNNNLGDDSLPIIVGSSSYDFKEIKTALNEYGNSVALDLISIDENNLEAILEFCKNYGFSIYTEDVDCDNSNDYIFKNTSKQEQLGFSIAANGQYSISIKSMQAFIKYVRQIFLLRDAIDKKELSVIIESVIYFSLIIEHELTSPDSSEGPIIFTNSSDLTVFNYEYYNFISSLFFYYEGDEYYNNLSYSDKIKAFLSVPTDDSIAVYQPEIYFSYGADHIFFSAMSVLLNRTIKTNDILGVDKLNGVTFSKTFSDDDVEYIVDGHEEEVLNLGKCVLINLINDKLSTVAPTLTYKNGKIVQDLKINSLEEAIYVDIFFRLGEYSKTRKCENPTCDMFFYARDTNKKKKYCSRSCSQLMAKRKQREREKEAESKT